MKSKFNEGDTVRRISDGLEAKVISVDNLVCTVECADWTDVILDSEWELVKDSGELTHSVTKTSDQEEPISEDLEEAAKKECRGLTDPRQVLDCYCQFIRGAKWQKRQMMKDSVECQITLNETGNPCIILPQRFNAGDEVKVIIVNL